MMAVAIIAKDGKITPRQMARILLPLPHEYSELEIVVTYVPAGHVSDVVQV